MKCKASRWQEHRSPLTCVPLASPSITQSQYDKKLCDFLDEYDTAFLVHADNVGSKQFMDIRRVRECQQAGVCCGIVVERGADRDWEREGERD